MDKRLKPFFIKNEKENNRKAVSFSINKNLFNEFKRLCNKKGLFMSRRIENIIENEIEIIEKI